MALVGCSCRFCIFISEDTFGFAEKGTAFHGDGKNSTQRVPSSLPKVMGTWS